jgi:CarD family transcriptional regulator
MFYLFDMVVYPSFGVAKLSREIIKRIENNEIFFFELNFINKDVKILIPKDNINSVGLRPLSQKNEIEEVFQSFLDPYPVSWAQDIALMSWNRRSKDYQAKIRCGSIRDIARIYRDLKCIEKNKVLSFGEKSVINQVEELLSEELSVIYSKSIDEIVVLLRHFTELSINSSCDKQLLENPFLSDVLAISPHGVFVAIDL